MQKKKWILLSKNNKREDVLRISSEYSLPPLIATVLLNRGIDDPSEYLVPEVGQLKDPFLMKGMEQAAERIAGGLVAGCIGNVPRCRACRHLICDAGGGKGSNRKRSDQHDRCADRADNSLVFTFHWMAYLLY